MSKAIEIQPPNEVKIPKGYTSVFLAGSIEMGLAENWQKKLVKDLQSKPFVFLNPRRKDWNSSWKQKITDKNFNGQVTWELDGLESCDIIVMYFDPETDSPISLLELGLHARSKKMVVLCPEGFWRKGNVDVVCEKYDVEQVKDYDELVEYLKNKVK